MMALQIIGAGFGRTGTRSLKSCLEILGLGSCYHMEDCFRRGDCQRWIFVESAVRRRDTSTLAEALKGIFSHDRGHRSPTPAVYTSTVDFPASVYFKELMDVYPDAKVILTVRDTAELWFESARLTIWSQRMRNTLWRLGWFDPRVWHAYRMVHAVMWNNPRLFDGQFDSVAPAVYGRWVDHVRASVPPEKLLVYNVKSGWGPLCHFLGVPVPDEPFPMVNDRAHFCAVLDALDITIGAVFAFTALVAGVFACVVFRLFS
jgi:hypothetical protein